MDKDKDKSRKLSFAFSHEFTVGIVGERGSLVEDLPLPMEIEELLTNAPYPGMFELEAFSTNGEELLAPRKDDLWLHRPGSIASAPRAKHSAPVTRVAMLVKSTGFIPPASACGHVGGCLFTLVVHVVGRPARLL